MHVPSLHLPCLFAIASLLGTGCEESSPDPAPEVPVRSVAEEQRVGSRTGPDALTRPTDATLLEDGSLWVVFGREATIRVVDPRGRIVRTVGRRGSGPGEFTRPGAVQPYFDSVVIADPPRLTLHPVTGGDPRTFVPVSPQQGSSDGALLPVAYLAGGRTLLFPRIRGTGLRPNLVDSVVLRAVGGDEDRPVAFAALNWTGSRMVIRDPDATGPAAVFTDHPFGAYDLWAVQPDGRGVLVVDRHTAADAGRVLLRIIDPQGDTVVDRRVVIGPPRRIRDSQVDSVVDQLVQMILESRGARPPNPRVGARWVRDALGDVPPFHPPVDDLLAAADGTIWLRKTDVAAPDEQEWLRLDARGDPLERVRLPGDVRILDAREDVVWGYQRDELDVPYLLKLRLTSVAK